MCHVQLIIRERGSLTIFSFSCFTRKKQVCDECDSAAPLMLSDSLRINQLSLGLLVCREETNSDRDHKFFTNSDITTMQSYAVILALVLVAAVQGFAPESQGRAGTQLRATLFDRISNMDLFAPKADQNEYGARNKKDVSTPSESTKFMTIQCNTWASNI